MSNQSYNLGAFDYHSPEDLAREAADHDFNAQYDDHRERYAAELADIDRWEEGEADYYDTLAAEEQGLTLEAFRAKAAAEEAVRAANRALRAKCEACKALLDPIPF